MNDLQLYAGLGAFGRGYMAGGVIGGSLGAAIGAPLGIVGGILGSRKQRKLDHQQAAEAWERQRPAYEAFEASLKGQSAETLPEAMQRGWDEFQKLVGAKTMTPDLPRSKRKRRKR